MKKPMNGSEHKMMPGEAMTGQTVDRKMMRCQAMKVHEVKMMMDMKAQVAVVIDGPAGCRDRHSVQELVAA